MPKFLLKRSARRSLSLEITRELDVLVRAPQKASRREIDAFVARHADWIEEHKRRMARIVAANPPPGPEEIERLKADAKAYIPGRVTYFAGMMGVAPTAVKINAARTRYGSCSARDSLNFSCLLMRRPPEAIDYVIVHELAHIVHKNHGKVFYALIERYLPGYRVLYGSGRRGKAGGADL